jgi:uncharacterized protein YaaN involved in tellurite resistance
MRKGKATLCPVKASWARIYQGIEETKKLEEEIKRSLREGTMIKI